MGNNVLIVYFLINIALLHYFCNRKAESFWILMNREMIGWQWHQLDHMQIIYTALQTDNHASTSPLSFYRLDALPAAQPSVSKH